MSESAVETTTNPAAPGTETTEPTQRDLEYHGKAHGEHGRDKLVHAMLGSLHTDADKVALKADMEAADAALDARLDAEEAETIAHIVVLGDHESRLDAVEDAWINVAHNAAHFTSQAGTWTVQAADLAMFAYKLIGKTMVIAFSIVNSSQTVANSNYLQILIPAGKTANRTVFTTICGVVAGIPIPNMLVQAAGGTTFLRIYADAITALGGAGGTFGPVPLTDNIVTLGEIVLETT